MASTAPQITCNSANCITSIGCYTEAYCASGVHSFTTAAAELSGPCVGQNAGFTPFTCAQFAINATLTANSTSSNVVIGVQSNGQCFYSTNITTATAAGSATGCTTACSADGTQTCGGGECDGGGGGSVFAAAEAPCLFLVNLPAVFTCNKLTPSPPSPVHTHTCSLRQRGLHSAVSTLPASLRAATSLT